MVWYHKVWYGMEWYAMVWYGVVWYHMALSGIIYGFLILDEIFLSHLNKITSHYIILHNLTLHYNLHYIPFHYINSKRSSEISSANPIWWKWSCQGIVNLESFLLSCKCVWIVASLVFFRWRCHGNKSTDHSFRI